MSQKDKDAIKKYDYFKMESVFEKTNFLKVDVDDIERKIDRLAFEYYDEEKDRTEIPFNRVIRTFYDDAMVYYAIKYCEKMGYYIRSLVDINCDSPIYIYQNSFRKDLPSVYSKERQERLIKKLAFLRSRVFEDLLNMGFSLDNISDFMTEQFYDIISSINDEKFNNDYDEYVKLRNELVSHNFRAMMSVGKKGINYFDEPQEFEDFYLFKTLEATEKYFKKYYNPDSIERPQKYSSFLFSYGRYMMLRVDRDNNTLLLRNNVFYEKYRVIRRLYEDGFEFDKIAEKLEMDISEVKRLYNYFMPVVSLDTECEYDEGYEEDFMGPLFQKDINNNLDDILSTFDERSRKIILLRYGFVDGECWTLQKIGDELGITRERVRQIENNLINYLRYMCEEKKLDSYVK
ncbi:MAG: hypothetical protein IKJ43_00255 [Bacilli bacterium]|nr:hypothetical protein [Bacilli bacterium]